MERSKVAPTLPEMNVSVLIYTKNEEIHLARCLQSVKDSNDLVVVDSFSTDRTREIAIAHGARFVEHVFTGFGDQRTWSLENIKLKNPWALILDADEVVISELWNEILDKTTGASLDVSAFRVRRRFYWRGQWVPRSSQYPSWVVRLIRVGRVRFLNRGHSETQEVDGRIEVLENDLIDDNLRGIESFRQRQKAYAINEAKYEFECRNSFSWANLFNRDPLQRRATAKSLLTGMPGRGFLTWIYLYLLRGGLLEGHRGWELCLEKARYQAEIARMKSRLKFQMKESRSDSLK